MTVVLFRALLLATLPLVMPAGAFAAMPLANYRAVYDLTLAGDADLAEAVSIKGRLVNEFTGSACAGYSTRLRFVTQSTRGAGDVRTDDVRSVVFETTDGYYEFTHETFEEDELVERTVGSAERTPAGGTVLLTEPEERTVPLAAGTAFPVEQITRLIEAALAGKRFVTFDLYDGTEGGELVYGTSSVIGEESTSGDDLGAETGIADAGFATQRHWPVTISNFRLPTGVEMTPDYTMSMILYENGVLRDVQLDYGGFGLGGTLTALEMLPTPTCPG